MPSKRVNAEGLTRRSFLKQAAVTASLPLVPVNGLGYTFGPKRLAQVFPDLNRIHKWDNSSGDTWDPFWADDGNLYAFNCDGRGFGPKGEGRNLAFNILVGDAANLLTGSQVNSMDDYGKDGKKGEDGATWKACGQECIDGVFYAFVSRNTYGGESHDPLLRQTAVNSSLIKSIDRGLTWTRAADENYVQPMWPGPAFGAPFFVHYGQNGGAVGRDGAKQFVYASSTNGFWNDGDNYILGRVERRKLPALESADWAYYTGGDGARDGSWSPRIADARPILSAAAHCGQGPICFIPALGLYLMVAWYNTATMTKWYEPNRMQYDFYQAEHPWGPWELVNSFDDSFISAGHMYGPSLCARFQESDDGEVRISMFTAGYPFKDIPEGLYKMWEIPLILRTHPASAATGIPGDDPRIVYGGAWTNGEDSKGNDDKTNATLALTLFNPHTRYTSSADSSAELKFSGSGIAVIGEKGPDFGRCEFLIDGKLAGTVELRTSNFPRISSVQLFCAENLHRGSHTIRIVNTRAAYLALQEFQVIQ